MPQHQPRVRRAVPTITPPAGTLAGATLSGSSLGAAPDHSARALHSFGPLALTAPALQRCRDTETTSAAPAISTPASAVRESTFDGSPVLDSSPHTWMSAQRGHDFSKMAVFADNTARRSTEAAGAARGASAPLAPIIQRTPSDTDQEWLSQTLGVDPAGSSSASDSSGTNTSSPTDAQSQWLSQTLGVDQSGPPGTNTSSPTDAQSQWLSQALGTNPADSSGTSDSSGTNTASPTDAQSQWVSNALDDSSQ